MSGASDGIDLTGIVEAQIRRNVSGRADVVVALSGGVDSMVLLDIACKLRDRGQLMARALHVNHGISPNAAHWEEFCRRACASRGIELMVDRILVRHRPGESLEENARQLRYDCFSRVTAEVILLAHHLDDQCETFFLRLLRGAGLQGMLAMPLTRPVCRTSPVPRLLRPLLGVTRAQILQHGHAHGLDWIEDESNTDTAFARNFLRSDILPRIEARFPGYRQAIERALTDLSDAADVVHARAEQDLADVCHGDVVEMDRMLGWPQHRTLTLLRAFLARHGCRAPSRARLQEAWRQLRDASRDAQVHIALEAGALRRYRNEIHWVASSEGVRGDAVLIWRGESSLTLPAGMGRLDFRPAQGAGVRLGCMVPGQVHVRAASGPLRFKSRPDRPTRTLKNLFQELGVPPWRRHITPVLQNGTQTLWVGDMGYDCRVMAASGEGGLSVEWVNVPSATG